MSQLKSEVSLSQSVMCPSVNQSSVRVSKSVKCESVNLLSVSPSIKCQSVNQVSVNQSNKGHSVKSHSVKQFMSQESISHAVNLSVIHATFSQSGLFQFSSLIFPLEQIKAVSWLN